MASLREHTYQDYKLSCSFCRKDEDEVKRLIAGPGVYICDECVELCNEIFDEDVEPKDAEKKE